MTKILVVNNDLDTMTLIKSWLEKKAYQVRYTSSADDVPEIMKEFDPQLVIVDVLQQKVVKKLKMNKKTYTIPVILMTGYASRRINNQLPVDDTIEKPFNLFLFEKKIEKLTRVSVS